MKPPELISITPCEKGVNEWRAYLHADYDGMRWEIRGYGVCVDEAITDALKKFRLPVEDWDCSGYPFVFTDGLRGLIFRIRYMLLSHPAWYWVEKHP